MSFFIFSILRNLQHLKFGDAILAQTLAQQLTEIQDSLSAARKAISYKQGDRELTRSYNLLLSEKKQILSQIAIHGSEYIEGQNVLPARRGPVFKKAVWK